MAPRGTGHEVVTEAKRVIDLKPPGDLLFLPMNINREEDFHYVGQVNHFHTSILN